MAFTLHLSAYEDTSLLPCREVLSSKLNDPSYLGDFSSLEDTGLAEYAIEQAYAKVKRLLQHITSLQRHRNAFVPANRRLPPEILAKIFGYCTRRQGIANDKLWMAYSQVCNHWREVALTTPTLWIDPDFKRQDLASLMIARAQQTPLHVQLSSPRQLTLLQHHNVKDFTFLYNRKSSSDPDQTRQIQTYLSGHFPDLRSLRLVGSLNASPIVEINLMSLQAPILHTLHLHSLYLSSWNASSMGNLTTLELNFCPSSSSHRSPSARRRILDILRSVPKLQSLRLWHAISCGALSPPAADDIQTLDFPHLVKLALRDPVAELRRLVPRLRMPKVGTIDIQSPGLYVNSEATDDLPLMSSIVHYILNNASSLPRPQIQRLSWKLKRGGVAKFTMGDDSGKHFLSVEVADIPPLGYAAELETYWKSLLSMIPTGQVTSFTTNSWRHEDARPKSGFGQLCQPFRESRTSSS